MTLPDGRLADREVVLHKGAAAIVPVDARGYVTLVRQHRVAINDFSGNSRRQVDYAGKTPFPPPGASWRKNRAARRPVASC